MTEGVVEHSNPTCNSGEICGEVLLSVSRPLATLGLHNRMYSNSTDIPVD